MIAACADATWREFLFVHVSEGIVPIYLIFNGVLVQLNHTIAWEEVTLERRALKERWERSPSAQSVFDEW